MRLYRKRAYLPATESDGCRILVDRLWPRGLRKETARIDLWLKDIAPSHELREWFGHDPQKWEEFQTRYLLEVEKCPVEVAQLRQRLHAGIVTLVYGAKDEEHNNAVVLETYLRANL